MITKTKCVICFEREGKIYANGLKGLVCRTCDRKLLSIIPPRKKVDRAAADAARG